MKGINAASVNSINPGPFGEGQFYHSRANSCTAILTLA